MDKRKRPGEETGRFQRTTVRSPLKSISPPADILSVLRVYADSAEPLDWFTAARAINPPPAKPDGRTRETRLWRDRELELIYAQLDAVDLGYLEEPSRVTGDEPNKSRITEAGKGALQTWDSG